MLNVPYHRPWLSLVMLFALVSALGCTDTTSTPGVATTGKGSTAEPAALPSEESLRATLDETIEFTRQRKLSPQVNNAWQIVHALLAYGDELELDERESNKIVPALSWLLDGGKVKGWTLVPGEKGLESIMEPGEKIGQGHEDQWLGYLAHCGVALDGPGVALDRAIVVSGKKFTVRDLLEQAKWDVYDGMEATWTLMGTSVYLQPTDRWMAKDGTEWSIERLLAHEVQVNLSESACGGTHCMYGVGSAVLNYANTGGELTGAWKTAYDKVLDTIRRAREFQQPDGGFSTMFFERSANSPDIALRINSTGHMFEYLALVLDDEQIREPWMQRACWFLMKQLKATQDVPLECGGLYHAAHGLKLYRARLFGPAAPSTPASANPALAKTPAADNNAPPEPPGK